MYLSEVNMKYGRLVVFMRYDSAEIWGFRYEPPLGICIKKNTAITGFFVSIVRDLKRSISFNART
jgi:hypothetical protein